MNAESFHKEIDKEYKRARLHHVMMHSFHEGYAIILEEVRELEKAIFTDAEWHFVQKELIQLGAMCLAFGIELLPKD